MIRGLFLFGVCVGEKGWIARINRAMTVLFWAFAQIATPSSKPVIARFIRAIQTSAALRKL
jgi:hypothetical protein